MQEINTLTHLSALLLILFATCCGATVAHPNFVIEFGECQGWSSTSVQMDNAVPELKSAIWP